MRTLKAAILIVLFLALSAWFVGSSKTFQGCIREDQHTRAEQPAKEGLAQFSDVFATVSLCSGEFIHKNGEAIVAVFTVILGIATILLWSATQQLVAEAKSTSARQLRAYVSVHGMSCSDWQQGNFPFASIIILNAGQTPAYDLSFWAHISVERFPLDSIEIGVGPRGVNLDRSPLGPGSTRAVAPRRVTSVSMEEHIAMSDGQAALCVKGRASYRDAFGEPRITEFVIVSGGGEAVGSQMRAYHEGNRAT